MSHPRGIVVSDAFAAYLDRLRETAYFPRCASLRNQGRSDPYPGIQFWNV